MATKKIDKTKSDEPDEKWTVVALTFVEESSPEEFDSYDEVIERAEELYHHASYRGYKLFGPDGELLVSKLQ